MSFKALGREGKEYVQPTLELTRQGKITAKQRWGKGGQEIGNLNLKYDVDKLTGNQTARLANGDIKTPDKPSEFNLSPFNL